MSEWPKVGDEVETLAKAAVTVAALFSHKGEQMAVVEGRLGRSLFVMPIDILRPKYEPRWTEHELRKWPICRPGDIIEYQGSGGGYAKKKATLLDWSSDHIIRYRVIEPAETHD